MGVRDSQGVWDRHVHIAISKVITNKDLLYRTWNSAQCHVAAWKGGEFWGKWIHVYVWLRHFAVHLKLPQYCLLIGCTSIQNKKLKKILMESSLSIISFLDSSFGVVLKQSSLQTRSSQVFFYFIFWVFYTFQFYIYICDSF